jgi:hypothetical protein
MIGAIPKAGHLRKCEAHSLARALGEKAGAAAEAILVNDPQKRLLRHERGGKERAL